MARLAVAVAVVIALAVGVWMLWPDDERGATTTEPLAASTTTSSPTTTEPAPTTTEDDHVVDTVEEAEEILRGIWFAWFEGIYNQDEDRIWEVSVTEEQVGEASDAFGEMQFGQPPTPDGLQFEDTEILLTTSDCLGVWTSMNVAFRGGASSGVNVLRFHEGRWKLLNYWRHRDDLWREDCDVSCPSAHPPDGSPSFSGDVRRLLERQGH